MPSFPPEIFRSIALVSHPLAARSIKGTNHVHNNTITKHVLVMGEMRWRLAARSRKNCLLWASRQGHIEIVSRLLSYFTDENDLALALLQAACGGHVNLVSLLLPNVTDYYGTDKALSLAAARGHVEVVKLFLGEPERIADPDWALDYALRRAGESRDVGMMKLLLDAGAGFQDTQKKERQI